MWRLKVDSVGEWTTMSGKLFHVLITRLDKEYVVSSMVQCGLNDLITGLLIH